MGLAVVARYSVLTEAQIAQATLESAGLHAVVLDSGPGASNPYGLLLVEGFRVAVLEDDLIEAGGLLSEAKRAAALERGEPDPEPVAGVGRRKDPVEQGFLIVIALLVLFFAIRILAS
jgi:hypothetical protein